ncbi:MAG TPA: sialidase family protein [Candidatus Latescibacteria bacterium]|nr:sialidase family protein [Candidatus Latescibacterota bacterium]HOS64065.1 sialidase family protein [Candidatus Latescibacterota bacterium]HPK74920.1 sialidase family protein [Candidatus Latescibacterota bacterium]
MRWIGVLLMAATVFVGCAAQTSTSRAGTNTSRAPNWISEVRYQDPRTQCYLGSPSIVRLPDGALLATHDYFGPGAPLNHEGQEFLTSVYRSEDNGRTWQHLQHLAGQYWSGLFVHNGAVYILGTSAHNEHIVIRRSTNGGYTWTTPVDDTTGLLFRGGIGDNPPGYHCAPVPVLKAQGRIWRAFEDNDGTEVFARGFKALVISADENADLLHASSWRMTNRLKFDQANRPAGWGEVEGGGMGWLEGNAVEGPDGRIWDILRVNSYPVLNKGAMVQVLDEGRRMVFDPATGFIDLPGGASKFTIRRDPQTGIYWMLSNDMEDGTRPVRRNRLSLFSSSDLRTWTKRATLLEYHGDDPAQAPKTTGFQYVDWQFDGDDIIYLVRTAYDGAHNFHDSNRITFGKVEGFRALAR